MKSNFLSEICKVFINEYKNVLKIIIMKKFQLTAIFLMSLTSILSMQIETDPVNDKQVLSEIIYVEDTEDVELGFNTQDYLPRGFNPYESFFNIHSIEFIEPLMEVNFDFEVKDFLPRGFMAGIPYFNVMEIPYVIDFDENKFYIELKAFLTANTQKPSK
jgi:hypothetical protein